MAHSDFFNVTALPNAVVHEARASRVDQFGNKLSVLRDGKPHQCRLRLSQPDEGVLLMAHRPFSSRQPYAESGPVFIHEHECDPYTDVRSYPAEFPRRAVVLRGYNDRDQIVAAEPVGKREVEILIAEMFESESVAYLHARNLGYGCYMFRIDRA